MSCATYVLHAEQDFILVRQSFVAVRELFRWALGLLSQLNVNCVRERWGTYRSNEGSPAFSSWRCLVVDIVRVSPGERSFWGDGGSGSNSSELLRSRCLLCVHYLALFVFVVRRFVLSDLLIVVCLSNWSDLASATLVVSLGNPWGLLFGLR